jgi:hypothetical protein
MGSKSQTSRPYAMNGPKQASACYRSNRPTWTVERVVLHTILNKRNQKRLATNQSALVLSECVCPLAGCSSFAYQNCGSV